MSTYESQYALLGLAAGVACVLAFIVSILALLFSRKLGRVRWFRASASQAEVPPSQYSLAMNLTILFLVEALLLVPVVMVLQAAAAQPLEGPPWRAVIGIVSLCAFLGLGLLYSIRKGDLSWGRVRRTPGESG